MLSSAGRRYSAYTCIDGSWMRFDGLAAPLTIGSAWGDVMQASVEMLAAPSVLFYEAESAGALEDTAGVRSGIEDHVSWKKGNPAFRRKVRPETLEKVSGQISRGGLGTSRNRELAIPPVLQLPASEAPSTTGAAENIPFDPVSCEPSPDGELPTISDCASPHHGEIESPSRGTYRSITQAAAAARADAQLCHRAAEVEDPVPRQASKSQVASMRLPSHAAGVRSADLLRQQCTAPQCALEDAATGAAAELASVVPSVARPSGGTADAGACGDAPAGEATNAAGSAGADAAAAADAAHEEASVELDAGQPLGRTLHCDIVEHVAADAEPGMAASHTSDSPPAAAPAGSAVDKAAIGVSGLCAEACDDAPPGKTTAGASDDEAIGAAAADAADEAPGANLAADQANNHLHITGSSTAEMEVDASSENLASLAPAATSAPVMAPAASTSAPTPPAASIAPEMPPDTHIEPALPSANAPPLSSPATACTEPAPASRGGGTAEQVEDVLPQAADELLTMIAAAVREAEKYLGGETDTPFGGTDALAITSIDGAPRDGKHGCADAADNIEE
ncbi:g11761 [Coccomyxa elongata]